MMPTQIDTTELAAYQDAVINRVNWSSREAVKHLFQLSGWTPMLSKIPTSNLHIRQALICGGLNKLAGVSLGQSGYHRAYTLFSDLRRNGYWLEGPDYLTYVSAAFEWWDRVAGNYPVTTDMRRSIESVERQYQMLIAPDGTIPVPEARTTQYGSAFHRYPDLVSTPGYIVKRWPSGAYLLVALDCDPEPRGNFHYHLAAGYFALWSQHKWAARCNPYTGWDPASVASDNGLQDLLPPGALTPTWRLKPPSIKVERMPDGVRITWKYPWKTKIRRRISWTDKSVTVVDGWGWFKKSTRSWVV